MILRGPETELPEWQPVALERFRLDPSLYAIPATETALPEPLLHLVSALHQVQKLTSRFQMAMLKNKKRPCEPLFKVQGSKGEWK